jgi:hypothetical protein
MSEGLEKGNFLKVLSQMKKEAKRLAICVAETGLLACKDIDVIVAGLGGLFVGFSLAEKFDIAFTQAYYIPFTPTRGFPSFLFPILPQGFSGVLNRLSYHIMRQMIWQSFRSTDKLTAKKFSICRVPRFGGHTRTDG